MKELLNYIVSHIVDNPEDVKITEEKTETGVINLTLNVNEDDMGIVIGKNGSTIRALRNLLKVKAIKEDVRFNLELVETSEN